MFRVYLGFIGVFFFNINFLDFYDLLMRRFVRKKWMVVVFVEYVFNLVCYRIVSFKVLLRLNKVRGIFKLM